MKRRIVLSTLLLAALGGVAAPALAQSPSNTHVVCLSGSNSPSGPSQGGLCAWVPLPVSPQK